MISLRIYQRKNRPSRTGECLIYLIVNNDDWITTGISVHPDYWDGTNSNILRKHPNYLTVNQHFSAIKSRAEQCISTYNLEGKSFNRKHFEKYVFLGKDAADNPDIHRLIKDYTNSVKMGWDRSKHYLQFAKDIDQVSKCARLQDLNYQFAMKLQQFLRSKNNSENTISRKMRMLKALVHFAQKCELINRDPLINVKVKNITGTKKHLSADELAILEELLRSGRLPGNLQNTLQYFLFSCYTGLRYSDVHSLNHAEIINDTVVTTQEKTEKPVTIPLIKKAKALIQIRSNNDKVFRVFTNQATNRFLKQIMLVAGISKEITYHCSRHTFGTLSIYWGIPIDVVAELMGVDMKTVKIYAKIVDAVKVREMAKWETATSVVNY